METYFSVAQAAALCGIQRASMQQRISRGTVAAVRSEVRDSHGHSMGWRWLIPASEVTRIVRGQPRN